MTGLGRGRPRVAVAVLLGLVGVSAALAACGPTSGGQPPAGQADPAAARIAWPFAADPTATVTPTPTATVTPTPTATPLHPLSVAAMRQAAYPGGDLAIDRALDARPTYRRYLVSYPSEGLKIYALLTVPLGERPVSGWPAVVFNHGYIPPREYRTLERYVAYVDAFARNGYVVIKPDYRGHGDSEGEAAGGYGSPAYTVDVLNALAVVRAHPDVDPDRVGMWGHSMGGHITLRAMVVTDTIRAGVIWAGVVASYPDLIARWHRRSTPNPPAGPEEETTPAPTQTPWPYSRRWRESFAARYGSPEQNPDFWAAISPISYAGEISGPVQLQHGTADRSVPLLFSELLRDALQAAGREIELYTYPGDDHNLAQNLSLALQRSVAFMDRHVKGE